LAARRVHQVATGSNVLIAVIDSQIDVNHPDVAGAIVEQFDATGRPDQPIRTGPGWSAPSWRISGSWASRGGEDSGDHRVQQQHAANPEATTRNILAGLEWRSARAPVWSI